jgi:hypothetical protein
MPTADRPRPSRRRVLPVAIAVAFFATASGAPPAPALAQSRGKTSSTSLIQRGSELFDDQAYEESIQTLSAALVRPGASQQEKIETYRLLAYNFIILKRADEADAAVRGILVLDEKFSLPPTESPRFRDFFEATRKKWEQEGKPGRAEVGTPLAPPKAIEMKHSSPAEVPPDTTIKLTGTVEDPEARVRGVQLAYRTGAKGKFVTVAATYTLGQFRTQIPAIAVQPPLVEYYLQAIDKGGLPLASRGDAATPLRIAVPAPSGGVLTSPWFWVPVGVVVVGGVVATALILSNSKGAGASNTPTSTVTIGVHE